MARHGDARQPDGGRTVHCDAGAPAGVEDRVPGRGGVAAWVHRQRSTCQVGRAPGKEWLWQVPQPSAGRRGPLMKVTATSIPDVLVIEPKVFGDTREFFLESFNQKAFDEAVGEHVEFVQDNHSRSTKGVLRGLHYQIQQPQGKLVRVARGAVFDVAVDIRRSSPTFGRWAGVELTEDNHRQLWVPRGFAHG